MAENSGKYTGTALADKTFYGFKINKETGRLTIEIINDQTTTVVIPDDKNPLPTDYKEYYWSLDAFEFEMSNTGHFIIKYIT